MPNLIVQENGAARTRAAEHGEEITIQSPCDCSAVTGVQIAGEVFDFCDACGNSLAGRGDLFAKGNLVRVLIDTVNGRAIIVNRAVTPKQIGAAEADHTHDDRYYTDDAILWFISSNADTVPSDLLATATKSYATSKTSTVGDWVNFELNMPAMLTDAAKRLVCTPTLMIDGDAASGTWNVYAVVNGVSYLVGTNTKVSGGLRSTIPAINFFKTCGRCLKADDKASIKFVCATATSGIIEATFYVDPECTILSTL